MWAAIFASRYSRNTEPQRMGYVTGGPTFADRVLCIHRQTRQIVVFAEPQCTETGAGIILKGSWMTVGRNCHCVLTRESMCPRCLNVAGSGQVEAQPYHSLWEFWCGSPVIYGSTLCCTKCLCRGFHHSPHCAIYF